MQETEIIFEPVSEVEALPALKEPGTNALVHGTFEWANTQ